MTRVFESNGPDIKIRGTASHVAEKYVQLARDARSSGDPVAAENYYQHAEHYFRLIAAAQEQFRQNQPQPRIDNEMAVDEDGDDDGESFSHFGQEPGFVRQQPQPFVRATTIRASSSATASPISRASSATSAARTSSAAAIVRSRNPQPQPQPVIADTGGVDRLPSFITGPQPQVNGAPGGFEGGGGERFPRRRRRPHGPRPDGMAAPAAPERRFQSGE